MTVETKEHAELSLSRGLTTKIDADDVPMLAGWKLMAINSGHRIYAAVYRKVRGKKEVQLVHRLLMGLPPALVFHNNGDPLDNRRANLSVRESRA